MTPPLEAVAVAGTRIAQAVRQHAHCAALQGLGKTIEVLACVLTHRAPKPAKVASLKSRVAKLETVGGVHCCGCNTHARDPEDPRVQSHVGTWVQCSGCEAWMHGSCVGLRGHAVPEMVLCAACMQDLCTPVAGVCKATLIVCPEAIQARSLPVIAAAFACKDAHSCTCVCARMTADAWTTTLDGRLRSAHVLPDALACDRRLSVLLLLISAASFIAENCGVERGVGVQKQWFDEIQRHIEPGALKVVTYSGQRSAVLASTQGALCLNGARFLRGGRCPQYTESWATSFMYLRPGPGFTDQMHHSCLSIGAVEMCGIPPAVQGRSSPGYTYRVVCVQAWW